MEKSTQCSMHLESKTYVYRTGIPMCSVHISPHISPVLADLNYVYYYNTTFMHSSQRNKAFGATSRRLARETSRTMYCGNNTRNSTTWSMPPSLEVRPADWPQTGKRDNWIAHWVFSQQQRRWDRKRFPVQTFSQHAFVTRLAEPHGQMMTGPLHTPSNT